MFFWLSYYKKIRTNYQISQGEQISEISFGFCDTLEDPIKKDVLREPLHIQEK